MAVDNRPFKSKEQDGQGNEVIIRDQQLVEQGTATTMASGAYFETRDVDDRPVKIPRDNMMNIVLECIGIILNDSSRNLGTNVQKALGLQGNTVGHSTVADFASVLGGTGRLFSRIENTTVLRAFVIGNYQGGTYIIQGNALNTDTGWFLIVRLHKQGDTLIKQAYLKVGNPLLYYQTVENSFEFYVKAGNYTYPQIIVSQLEYGAATLRFDNFDADVSQMTQVTFT